MKKSIYLISFIIIISGFTFNGCPDPPPQITDCDLGYLPCKDDQSECCEVICEDGYHLGGADSTECVLDTTSHNFFWEIDTLGIYGSYLNDVAIVNENDIWVVGKIETDTLTYNVGHWNGFEWELLLIDIPVSLEGVYATDTNDIWFTNGCGIYHYSGSEFIKIWECNWQANGPGQVNKIIQTENGDIYTIGNNGYIYKYNGSIFIQMTTNTSVDLNDIAYEGGNIFVSGYSISGENSGFSILLELVDNQWNTIVETDHFYPNGADDIGLISAVWVNSDTCYIMSYSGIKKYSVLDQNISHWVSLSQMYASDRHILKFMGSNRNDLIFADGWGYFIYYNGNTWVRIDEIHDIYNHGDTDLNQMQYKDNIIVAVGKLRNTQKGLIVIGNVMK